jgi:F-type H+-transporting ATPase subunit b
MVDINITLLFQFINFVVIYWLLKFLFFKPLLAVMDARREKLGSLMTGFVKERDEIERLESEYAGCMREVYRDVAQVRSDARNSAEQERRTILEKSKAEADEQLKKKQDKIDQELTVVEEGLTQHVGTLKQALMDKFLV